LVIIEAFKNSTMPSSMELIALVFGFYGAMVLVIPKGLARVLCFCCLGKLHPDLPEMSNREEEESDETPSK
jgi:hypothetical protein